MAPSLFALSRPAPLADRLRPKTLDEVVGQDHLLAPDGADRPHAGGAQLSSLILWGPPGSGKTTIARLLAEAVDLHFEPLSAVFSGVADLRKVFEAARKRRDDGQRHAAVRRRDPPLQPRPAGRLPALRRGRHGHAGRRHDREPVVRAERRAAVALPGVGAEPARRRRAGTAAGPRRGGARPERCRSTRRRRAGAARHGRRRRPLPAEPGRAAVAAAGRTAPLDAGAAGDPAAEARAALRQGAGERTTT